MAKREIDGTYWEDNARILKDAKDGPIVLCNFTAWIEEERIFHDDKEKTMYLGIRGELYNKEKPDQPNALPMATVNATDFKNLNWIAQAWGMKAILYNVPGAATDVAIAIQIKSKPIKHDIYTHTGWNEVDGQKSYLFAGGAINASGLRKDVEVVLPNELKRFELPPPAKDMVAAREAFAASMRLINLGPKNVTWPLWLATYRAAIGEADFAVHLAGRTGTFKSEISSLMQSHYGKGMDARHLPCSWSSTANALEALTYKAKNAICVIDDYVPVGTSYAVKQLDTKVDQVIRAQGNQAGRQRMTDAAKMNSTYFPRGIILSTGEDIPNGHSVRARMMICELSPNSISTEKLTASQKERDWLPVAMAGWIQWLASKPDIEKRAKEISDANRSAWVGIGHSRTPGIMGEMAATLQLVCEYASEMRFASEDAISSIHKNGMKAIDEQGRSQAQYLEASDPVIAFTETIRRIIGQSLAHVKTRSGGIPEGAQVLGWTRQGEVGGMDTWKSNGPTIAWLDADKGELLVDPNMIPFIKKHSDGKVSNTPTVLAKRLVEAGVIIRRDQERERNTIRVTVDGSVRQMLVLDAEVLKEA